jgi:hypothetical protein
VTVRNGGFQVPGVTGSLTGGKSISVAATSVVVTGLAGLVALTGLAGCTSSSSSSNANSAKSSNSAKAENSESLAEAKSPTLTFSGKGSGSMEAIAAPSSLYAEQVRTSSGALYRLRAPGADRDVFVAADSGAFAKRTDGWKISTVSTDAMWDPDRCSTLDPVDAGSKRIAMFETGVQPAGDASPVATPSWYQLTVTDGKTFQRLTPTPAFGEIALPKTLTALGGNRVGYLWADGAKSPQGSVVAGSSEPGSSNGATSNGASSIGLAPAGIGGSLAPSSPNAQAAVMPVAMAGAGSLAGMSDPAAGLKQLHWREVNLKSMAFADRLVTLPDGQVLKSAYRLGSQVVLETKIGGQYGFDPIADDASSAKPDTKDKSAALLAMPVALITKPLTQDTTPTEAEQKLLSSVDGLSDARILSRSTNGAVVQVAHIVGEQMVFDVASLNTKRNKLSFAPVMAAARRCLVSRD